MYRISFICCVALLAALAPRARAAWPPGPEVGFTADVYPSAVDAARGLAPRLEGLVREAAGGRAPRTIHVSGEAPAAVIEALADAMRRSFGDGGNVVTTAAASRPADGDVHVRPLIVPAAGSSDVRAEAPRGSVVIGVHAATGERECSARFVSKPWLTNFEQFRTGRDGRWVVGQADEPAATRDEATKAAVGYAVAEIMPLIAGESGGNPADVAFAAQRVTAALTSGRFVADRFACRFERPYGNVYHEAILVDASPANLNALAGEATALRKQTVRSTLGTAGSLAGLVASILVIYLLANWLTKGYFAGRLRAAAVVALVSGTVLVLVLAGLFTRSAIRMDAPLPVVVN